MTFPLVTNLGYHDAKLFKLVPLFDYGKIHIAHQWYGGSSIWVLESGT